MKNKILIVFVLITSTLFSQIDRVVGNGIVQSPIFDTGANYDDVASCNVFHTYTRESSSVLTNSQKLNSKWVLKRVNGSQELIINPNLPLSQNAQYDASTNSVISTNLMNGMKVIIIQADFDTLTMKFETLPSSGFLIIENSMNINFLRPGSPAYVNLVEHSCNNNTNENCLISSIENCGTMSCVKVTKVDSLCHSCYCVVIEFENGTMHSFHLNFNTGGNVMMNCFGNKIKRVVKIEKVLDCGGCDVQQSKSSFNNSKEIENELMNIENKVNVYPNPASEFLSFEGENLKTLSIQLFDNDHKILIEKNSLEENLNIDFLKSGIYFYEIKNSDGYKQRGKIIKK